MDRQQISKVHANQDTPTNFSIPITISNSAGLTLQYKSPNNTLPVGLECIECYPCSEWCSHPRILQYFHLLLLGLWHILKVLWYSPRTLLPLQNVPHSQQQSRVCIGAMDTSQPLLHLLGMRMLLPECNWTLLEAGHMHCYLGCSSGGMEVANMGMLAARIGTPKSSQSAQEVAGLGNALAQLVVEGSLVLPVGHCFLVARSVHH